MLPAYRKMMLFFACCIADGASAAQTRTHFLDYGPSAAASGMGEANIAYGLDAGAIYYNPALMYAIRDQATASHWFLYDGARYDFVGVVVNNETSAFGLGGTQFYRDNIEARQTITDPGTPVQNDQMAAYGSYAGRISRFKLNYGASVKWLKYTMGDFSADGFGLDLGLTRSLFSRTYSMGKKVVVTAGASAANIYQTGIKMDTEKEYAPLTIKAAVSFLTTLWPKYSRDANKLTYDKFLWEAGLRMVDGSAEINTGVQYTSRDRYIVRAGYARGITVGCGLGYGDIAFDYAFLMKDLANFHRIGFSYSFGRAEMTEITMPITEDFQKMYQQATRVYERFVRNAEDLMKQERHDDARLLLLKAIPLNPKSNGDAKDLLKVCDQVLQSKRTTDMTAKANEILPKDITAALVIYLDVYAITADAGVLGIAEEMIKKEPALAEKKKTFADAQINVLNGKLEADDFEAAEKQLAVIRPLVDADTSGQLASAVTSRKALWVDKLVSEAMKYMQKDDYVQAYAYFREAWRLSGDAGIKDQMNVAEGRYFSGRKFSVEDNIYADKLYYRMAYNFATDAAYRTVRGELTGFNPFYDLTEFKRSLIALDKEAPGIFPIK